MKKILFSLILLVGSFSCQKTNVYPSNSMNNVKEIKDFIRQITGSECTVEPYKVTGSASTGTGNLGGIYGPTNEKVVYYGRLDVNDNTPPAVRTASPSSFQVQGMVSPNYIYNPVLSVNLYSRDVNQQVFTSFTHHGILARIVIGGSGEYGFTFDGYKISLQQ